MHNIGQFRTWSQLGLGSTFSEPSLSSHLIHVEPKSKSRPHANFFLILDILLVFKSIKINIYTQIVQVFKLIKLALDQVFLKIFFLNLGYSSGI